jgi:hypothetical protein
MRTLLVLAIGGFLVVGLAWPAARTARRPSSYNDGTYGFAITPPRFPAAARGTNITPVILYAPPENGFASNVNVVIQNASMSRQAYRNLSVQQFQQLGYTVNSERNLTVSGRDAILFDYEGTLQGRDLRFLALAVLDTDRILLVTGTAPRESFKKYEPGFRAAIGSFRVAR